MFDVGDRIRNKKTKEYGVIINCKKFPFQRQVISIRLDSGRIIEVNNLSLWVKVLSI